MCELQRIPPYHLLSIVVCVCPVTMVPALVPLPLGSSIRSRTSDARWMSHNRYQARPRCNRYNRPRAGFSSQRHCHFSRSKTANFAGPLSMPFNGPCHTGTGVCNRLERLLGPSDGGREEFPYAFKASWSVMLTPAWTHRVPWQNWLRKYNHHPLIVVPGKNKRANVLGAVRAPRETVSALTAAVQIAKTDKGCEKGSLLSEDTATWGEEKGLVCGGGHRFRAQPRSPGFPIQCSTRGDFPSFAAPSSQLFREAWPSCGESLPHVARIHWLWAFRSQSEVVGTQPSSPHLAAQQSCWSKTRCLPLGPETPIPAASRGSGTLRSNVPSCDVPGTIPAHGRCLA